jgi:predicted PurR-regulated permease PerM
MPVKTDNKKEYSFPQKVWIAGSIISLIIVLLLLLKATFGVLLLILAGTLIAVFFRGLGGLIQRHTHWKEGWCVLISVIVTLGIIILLLWLMGAKIQSQVQELSDTLPKTIQNAKSRLGESELGQKLIARFSSSSSQEKMQRLIQTFFKSTFGVLADLYVVLFIGIFFTSAPGLYKQGIIKLIPPAGKNKANEVLEGIASNLKKWLKGKLFAMLVVFVLTAIGLLIIGMPMWLVLALIAGLLNFIPNFGPLIALIPAVLVAMMQGSGTVFWVVALYMVVQAAESNFITPMVQHKLIRIPPAIIIIAQLLIAPLTGGWGLILATPLMVIVIVIVQQLYIKKQQSNE